MSSNPACPEEGFSCYRAVGRVEKLLDTRRAVRPAKSGFRFDSFAARPDYTRFFTDFPSENFVIFPRLCRKLFPFEDMYGREAEAQDVHQRVAW